jgi:hypothetical protein
MNFPLFTNFGGLSGNHACQGRDVDDDAATAPD